MRTIILTLGSFERNAREIGGPGAVVYTRWPSASELAPDDLLMIFLHPSLDGRAWLDDAHEVVVTSDELSNASLLDAVVFVGACYGVENEAMIEALKQAGAEIIVAAPGANFGGSGGELAGADWLAKGLRVLMGTGLPFDLAWPLARTITRTAAGTDAMEYRVVWRRSPTRPLGRQIALGLAGVLAVIAFLLQVALGGSAPSPMTFFSSLPATGTPSPAPAATWTPDPTRVSKPWLVVPDPTATCVGPDCIPLAGSHLVYFYYLPLVEKNYDASLDAVWSKQIYVNGVITTTTPAVTASDTITIVDHVAVGSTTNVTFTLVESWTNSLSFTGWISDTGSVVTGTGALTWTVANVAPYQYWVISKTWVVTSGLWTVDLVTETLSLVGGNPQQQIVSLTYSP